MNISNTDPFGVQGQWIGRPQGTNNGLLVLDLDELENGYAGHAYLFDEEPGAPYAVVKLELDHKLGTYRNIDCRVFAIHPQFPVRLNNLDLARDFPTVSFPQTATIGLTVEGGTIRAVWSTNIGTHGEATLIKTDESKPSALRIIPDIDNWDNFKSFALRQPVRKFVFRGQDKPYRLRTSFHRTRRKDLITYLNSDIPNAHHILSAQTKHLFNLSDNIENAAFLNLLQHHGYPTPLLDWTYSPFVAAFFAFRFRRNRTSSDDMVRILMLDKSGWEAQFEPVAAIAYGRPHFSMLEPLSIENPRALPQQSVSSITNLDDIETFIQESEAKSNKQFLFAIDLPFSSRRKVMQELSTMGITAGSLFPGLDGACEELRGRFFHPFD